MIPNHVNSLFFGVIIFLIDIDLVITQSMLSTQLDKIKMSLTNSLLRTI